jgi:glycosyltransferase involved in cell wall biosynthesis
MTSVHPPTDNRIYHKMCRSLTDAGFAVTLVAAESRHKPPASAVRLVTVPKAKGRLGRMLWTAMRVCRAALRERADIYHFHDPELIPWGFLMRALGRRVVYDAHENLPAMLRDRHYLPPVIRPVLAAAVGFAERFLARFFSAVCAATPVIAARLKNSRLTVIQNFPTDRELGDAVATAYEARKYDLIYVGSITVVRGIKEVLAALLALNRTRPTTLQLVGSVAPSSLLDELKADPAWAHVAYHGQLGRAESQAMMRQSRVGLVVLRPAANYLDSYPTKMFEYLAAGAPVLASDFTLWRSIVERSNCGVVVDPLDPDAIAAAAARLLGAPVEADAMGRRGRDMVLRDFRWLNEERKLVALYRELLGRAR